MSASSRGLALKTEWTEAISIGVTPRAAAKIRYCPGGIT